MSEKLFMDVIESCERVGSYHDLIQLTSRIFCDPIALKDSFLVRADNSEIHSNMTYDKNMHSTMTDQPDETSGLEVIEDAESISMETDQQNIIGTLQTDSCTCAKCTKRLQPTCNFHHVQLKDSFDNDSNHDEVSTLDLWSLRRLYDRLFAISCVTFQAALISAISQLSRTLETDLRLRSELAKRANYINIYLVIMEIPHLDRLEYLEKATPLFCKTLAQLPIDLQAQLARIWGTYKSEELRAIVRRLQQLITVRLVSNHLSMRNSVLINDDDVITSATKILKIAYYASVVGGRLDSTNVEPAVWRDETGSSMTTTQNFEVDAPIDANAFSFEDELAQACIEDDLALALGVCASDCRVPLIPAEDFINESLSDGLEIPYDYVNYIAAGNKVEAGVGRTAEAKFSFMHHSFILTTVAKHACLCYDHRMRKSYGSRDTDGAVYSPYLRLHIRRDHVIEDALANLEMVADNNPRDLKKQLFVVFEGEQGIDEGGVSKEFFQLVVEEIFNPDIGMFSFSEETRMFWFSSTSFENEAQFFLIGLVLGLAIYNNVILDIRFPPVVYRKLMGKPGRFEDLFMSHPVIANSLRHMLNYEGDIREAFAQPFCVATSDVFGHAHLHELKPDGHLTIVDNNMKEEFVMLYADFLLNKSIEKPFHAFRRGFQLVTDQSLLSALFRPEEIELLISGSQKFDFNAFEKAAEYDSGFSSNSPVIRYFWEVVHEMSLEQKRQLLQFATGSDRVPIGGLSKLKLVIARNGPDSDRLPTAHTCFNVLLLPDYCSKDKLKERFLIAISNSKGFGMF